MTTHNEPSIARRPFLKGAGVTLATLGGMTGSAVAGGHGEGRGKQPLNDLPADMMLYWSMPGELGRDEPRTPEAFGYFSGFDPAPPGGLFLPTHDPQTGQGDMFEFSNIQMSPNGQTLENRWTFFGGAMLESRPKPYVLVHEGDGVYRSRGQTMRFEAQESDGGITSRADIDLLRYPLDFPVEALRGALFPPVEALAGKSWLAVGTEQAVLETDADGNPTLNPAYAGTRIDFYSPRKHEYALSMLYLIWQSNTETVDPVPGMPLPPDGTPAPGPGDVHSLAMELINGG